MLFHFEVHGFVPPPLRSLSSSLRCSQNGQGSFQGDNDEEASPPSSSLCHQQHSSSSLRYLSSIPNNFAQEMFESDASSLWQQEWHDSFCRNGFADFVPPMNSNVKCLLLDNNAITRIDTTGSDVGDGLDGGSRYDSSSPDITDGVETATSNKTKMPWDPFSPSSSTPSRSNGEREYTDYADSNDGFDCILDRGFINDLLLLSSSEGKERVVDDSAAMK